MARKARSDQTVYMTVRGADGKFKSVGRKAKAPAAKKAKQTKKTMAAPPKRVATAKQLAALAKARAARTHAKLTRMYGAGGGLPVGGPSGVSEPTTAGNAISSIVAAPSTVDRSTYAVAPKNTDY